MLLENENISYRLYAKHISDKLIVSRFYEELSKQHKTTHQVIKKWAKDINALPKEIF